MSIRTRRAFTCCATVITAAGLASASGPAVAQNVPRPGPLVRYEVSIKNSAGRVVFDFQGRPNAPDVKGRFDSMGTVRFSPKLCEGAYRLRFRFTTNKGDVTEVPYPARARGGRLDGVAKRCPFAGLPRGGFRSMHVRATIDRKPLLTFGAQPFKRSHDPFARLNVLKLTFRRPNTPAGLLHARFRLRYAHHKSHTIEFTANTNLPLPGG